VDTEVPWDVGKRIVAGESAVKVYREWRGLTREALARKVDSAKAYISQIETGAKPGSRAILRRIAAALGVPAAVLMED
jgi:mRNA interferase RelE/StbE